MYKFCKSCKGYALAGHLYSTFWSQKTGKSTAKPKLCGLPPTTEAFEQNVYRAHFQVAQWYSALSGNPLTLNVVDYGWEADEANKCLIPRNIAEGVSYAPEQILKLVKCGCVSERSCKGANCGCSTKTMWFATNN